MGSVRFSRRFTAYVLCVVFVGGAAIVRSVYELYTVQIDPQWLVLAALTLLSGSITVKIPSVSATLSVSEVFVFTSVLLFGPAAGTVTAALDGLIISLWLQRKAQPLYRIFFNATAPALALWTAANFFFYLARIQPLSINFVHITNLLLPLAAFTTLYFLLNTWFIAFAIGLEQRLPILRVWKGNFLWLSLNYFSGASVAALLVAYTRQIDLGALWIIVPILVITYLTYKTAMGRVEDADRHVSHLNSLYISTVETLAMAIDAKDQITHGHIRRVQQYAVGLARRLGVTDVNQIKAIEAAALLHDMGKLAVPDYILNKPGPLTRSEYEKIKLHSGVGADILSSIKFPYPVVPIVRHHHENWDGSGYPDGLKGADIPIGARILSVVDCFDALTSDRPYRPRLSEEAALNIVLERRGTMYDPVVVNTFMEVKAEIAAADSGQVEEPYSALSAITEAAFPPSGQVSAHSSPFDAIAPSSEEMLVLSEISRGLSGSLTFDDAASVIERHLRRAVPATFCVFFLYEPLTDDLAAVHAAGDSLGIFSGLRIPLGQRLTGWVAANRQTIVNSDPMLDLGDTARRVQPALRSSLSTPLIADDRLVGVLSLYSSTRNAFADNHRRLVEAVARQASEAISSSWDLQRRTSVLRGSLTGLPDAEGLQRFIDSVASLDGRLEVPCAVLFIHLKGRQDVNRQVAPTIGDTLLAEAAQAIQSALRESDLLFRYRSDGFVVFLAQADATVATTVASRVEAGFRAAQQAVGVLPMAVTAGIGVASAPNDGQVFEELLSKAKQHARRSFKHQDKPKPSSGPVH